MVDFYRKILKINQNIQINHLFVNLSFKGRLETILFQNSVKVLMNNLLAEEAKISRDGQELQRS